MTRGDSFLQLGGELNRFIVVLGLDQNETKRVDARQDWRTPCPELKALPAPGRGTEAREQPSGTRQKIPPDWAEGRDKFLEVQRSLAPNRRNYYATGSVGSVQK
jgi:hypothetical protein